MKINRDEQARTLTLVPVTTEEELIIAAILARLKPGEKLEYGGASQDGEGSKNIKIHLHAGGHKEERREKNGNVTLVRNVIVDSAELILSGTTAEDKREVGHIRYMCYWGSFGLVLLGSAEVDGKRSLVTTGKPCQHCANGMITRCECEWKTCSECAAKCEHTYVTGAVHGGGLDIGVGEYCDKCGRGKPLEEGVRDKSVMEQHKAVEKELGVTMLYKNPQPEGPPLTLPQVVKRARTARRYNKAQSRG